MFNFFKLGIKTRILLIGLVVLIIAEVSVVLYVNRGGEPAEQPIATTTPTNTVPPFSKLPDESEEYKKSVEEISAADKSYHESRQRVAKLINKLPYSGNGFRLEYNISNNQFIVTIKGAKGEEEFAAFLNQNGIMDKALLDNLIVR